MPAAPSADHPRALPAPGSLLPLLGSRFSWRHWLGEPGQTLLLVAVLSLGVAVYLSVRLANRAAVASFERFTVAVTGQGDFILAPAAGPFSEAWLGEIRRALGPEPVDLAPILEVTAAPPRRPGQDLVGREAFQLVGLDLVAAGNFLAGREVEGAFFAGGGEAGPAASERPADAGRPTLREALQEPDRVWVSAALAQRDRLQPGSRLDVIVNDSVAGLEVAGTLPVVAGLPAPARTLVVMDLPALQRLAGRAGTVDRVEVTLPEGPGLAPRRALARKALEAAAAGRWQVETPASRRETGETMTAAFRLNLTVLSLIALLVGLLLIVQALDGAVVRRRQEIAILRSLGVEARTIRAAWLLEAGVLGLAAGVLGSLLGWAAAQFTVRLVSRTVNALYYANSVQAATLSWVELGGGVLLGTVASVLAGWIPAREAAGTPPAQMLARGHVASGLGFLRRKTPALALLAAGIGLCLLPALPLGDGVRFPLAGYAAALCWILGAGMIGGALFAPLGLAAGAAGRHAPTLRMASGHLRHPAGRHRLALAGLVAAVGMSAGMIILVASFEHTVRGWIEDSLRADLFVASDGAQNASATNRLRPATWRALAADPDAAGLELFQGLPVRIDGLPTFLAGFGVVGDVPPRRFAWIDGPDVDPADAPETPGIAYASESFTERFEVGRGDVVEVPTPAGPQSLRLAGVFADYGNERGSLVVPRERLVAWTGSEDLVNLSAHLRPGVDPEAVRARWLEAFPGLRILTNEGLRGEILRIFRQTFAITYALEMIGVLVAVAGLALTLASMLIDRRDELTTLRALGFTHGEIARAAAWEGAATAVAGCVAGIGLSLALGYLLVFVVNKQSFGWTLQFVVPAAPLAALGLAVVLAGTLVSWAVGRWGAALPADREE